MDEQVQRCEGVGWEETTGRGMSEWLSPGLHAIVFSLSHFPSQFPPQSVSDHGGRAAVGLPTPAFLLRGWPSNYDHKPLPSQDPALHGQSHVD